MSNQSLVRDYLFDILKIVDGAVSGDPTKVVAYAQQLSERLETAGETEGAKRIRQTLSRSAGRRVTPAGAAQTSLGSQVPVEAEFRLPMADEEQYGRGEVPLFLAPAANRRVQQFLKHYQAADQLIAGGVGISSTMLLFGPPGCGKTQVARFLSAELQLPLITARMDGLISSYLGSTAKNLRMLFEHFMSRPCILFLDELDAVGKMRDDTHELGELKRVVISLLQNIDAMDKDHILIAATNHEHLLDPALWRRFNYRVHLEEPDAAVRVHLLEHFFGAFGDRSLIETTAALGKGLSGAQLRQIAEESIRSAILNGQASVNLQQALLALLESRMGASFSELDLAAQLSAVREIDEKVFTQSTLAEMFGLSQPKVSRLLKESSEKPGQLREAID